MPHPPDGDWEAELPLHRHLPEEGSSAGQDNRVFRRCPANLQHAVSGQLSLVDTFDALVCRIEISQSRAGEALINPFAYADCGRQAEFRGPDDHMRIGAAIHGHKPRNALAKEPVISGIGLRDQYNATGKLFFIIRGLAIRAAKLAYWRANAAGADEVRLRSPVFEAEKIFLFGENGWHEAGSCHLPLLEIAGG